MTHEPDQKEFYLFMGKMDEWKQSMTRSMEKNFDSVIERLDGFVTMSAFEDEKTATKKALEAQSRELLAVKKKLNILAWVIGALVLLITCGELAFHRLDVLFGLFK